MSDEQTPPPTVDDLKAAIRLRFKEPISDDDLVRMGLESLDLALARDELAALLVWSPQEGAYRIGQTERLIARIACEVKRQAPNPEFPLSWAIERFPSALLTEDERLAIAEFMAARWRAWADSYPEQRLKPHMPGIIRVS